MLQNTKSIEVRDLKPGMILAWTRYKVLTTPTAGISAKHGSMDFIVETLKGDKIQKSWNRFTHVTILTD